MSRFLQQMHWCSFFQMVRYWTIDPGGGREGKEERLRVPGVQELQERSDALLEPAGQEEASLDI